MRWRVPVVGCVVTVTGASGYQTRRPVVPATRVATVAAYAGGSARTMSAPRGRPESYEISMASSSALSTRKVRPGMEISTARPAALATTRYGFCHGAGRGTTRPRPRTG
ncbi:hypothetical protein EES45_08515 [Streptomyces sp. ADI97-07]|nr:hypothetical protein EES45_08515 [Streptomyces sp. ADI97-07]